MKKVPASATVYEVEVDGKTYTKVNYSKYEEIANCVTHFIGALAYIGCLVYMLTISVDARTVAASLITCLSAFTVYAVSTVYHMVQDTRKKFIWRKIDHSDIPFLVTGCGSAVCLCLSNHPYNYWAIGICLVLSVISVIINVIDVDKYKVPSMTINFVIGIFLFAAFMINLSLIPPLARYLFLTGAILCTLGSIIFGFKVKYMHALFHVFVVAGTLCFYAASVLILQNYAGI